MCAAILHLDNAARKNQRFRHVVHTSPTNQQQLTLMTLRPKENIGYEIHPTSDQFIYFVKGQGILVINKREYPVAAGDATIIHAGSGHDVINTCGNEPLHMYVIYSRGLHPPNEILDTKPEQNED